MTRKSNPIEQQYTLKGKSLEVSENQKDLGVYINSTLTWSDQTHDQCMKANRMLGFLSRSAANEVDINTHRTLYLALVRSKLGYATQVWSPQSINLVSRIERVQTCRFSARKHTRRDSSLWTYYQSLQLLA